MAQDHWRRHISPKSPGHFDGQGVLDLHTCSQTAAGGAPSTLQCSVDGHPKLTICRLASTDPHARIRVRFEQEVTFTCDGPEVLLVGVLTPDAEERPAKVARVETPPVKAAGGTASAAAAPVKPAAGSKDAKPATAAANAAGAKPAASSKDATPAVAAATVAKTKPASSKDAEPAATASNGAAVKPAASGNNAKPAAAAAAASPAAPTGKKKKEEPLEGAVQRRILTSGLQYEVMKAGKGNNASLGKTVQVRYDGRLAKTGHRFDKGMIKFRLGVGEVIRGWDEGVKGMLVGERRRLLVPSRLGYGAQGAPPAIPRNADLVFEVELLAC